MARKFQFLRGLKKNLPTLAEGQPAFTTDEGDESFYIGNGSKNIQIPTMDQVMELLPDEDDSIGEGTLKFYGTLGTTWAEDSDTGVKTQMVAIEGVTADMELGRLDTINTHDRTSDGYAAYVEEQNQFLNYITNGDAETVDGGVMFYIYGDQNTVAIPFGLVV